MFTFADPLTAFCQPASDFDVEVENAVLDRRITWRPTRRQLAAAEALGGFDLTAYTLDAQCNYLPAGIPGGDRPGLAFAYRDGRHIAERVALPDGSTFPLT